MGGLFSLLVTLILLGILFYFIVWVIGWIGVEEPFNKIIKAVVGIFFIFYLLGALFGQVPTVGNFWSNQPNHSSGFFWNR